MDPIKQTLHCTKRDGEVDDWRTHIWVTCTLRSYISPCQQILAGVWTCLPVTLNLTSITLILIQTLPWTTTRLFQGRLQEPAIAVELLTCRGHNLLSKRTSN